MFICTSNIDWFNLNKRWKYYRKVFLEKYYFIEDVEIYCSNSDKEYYDEEWINLFLKTLKEFSLSFCFPKYTKIFILRKY